MAETSKYFEFYFNKNMVGKDIDLYSEGNYIATFNIGKKAMVRIKKNNPVGKTLINTIKSHEKVEFRCLT